MSNKIHVKTGDTVVVLSGTEKGKKGKILAVSPKEGKVIIEKVNLVSKHVKPRRMGDQGGIVEAEGAMYASKVQVVCPRCGKPTRVGHKILNGQVGLGHSIVHKALIGIRVNLHRTFERSPKLDARYLPPAPSPFS